MSFAWYHTKPLIGPRHWFREPAEIVKVGGGGCVCERSVLDWRRGLEAGGRVVKGDQ